MTVKKEPKVITFGCRLNTYESEVMRGHATAAGLDDAIIVNTCAVTSEAEKQLALLISEKNLQMQLAAHLIGYSVESLLLNQLPPQSFRKRHLL